MLQIGLLSNIVSHYRSHFYYKSAQKAVFLSFNQKLFCEKQMFLSLFMFSGLVAVVQKKTARVLRNAFVPIFQLNSTALNLHILNFPNFRFGFV